jgi:hypothetical protein
VLTLSAAACKSSTDATPTSTAEAPKRVADCRPGHLEILADVMNCRMTPFSKGQLSEAEFRETLVRLRELAPEPAWETGDNSWPGIIDGALQSHEYMPACKQCHRAYIEKYRKQYHDRKIGPL